MDDPVEVREERVTTSNTAVPVNAAEPVAGAPVDPHGRPAVAGVPPVGGAAPVAATDAYGRPAAAPVAAAATAAPVAPVTPVAPAAAVVPPAVAPAAVAPAATTGVYTSRTGVYPVGYRSIQTVWLIVGIVNIVLALDFIFRAAGANDTGFANLIYRAGRRLAAPFDGIFNTTAVANGNAVFRWADLLAIAVYTIAAWIITKIIRIAATPRTGVTSV